MVQKRQALYLTFVSFWVATLELARRTRGRRAYQHPPNITCLPKQHSILNSRPLKRERKRGREETGIEGGRKKKKERESEWERRPLHPTCSPQLLPQVWRYNILLMEKFSKADVASSRYYSNDFSVPSVLVLLHKSLFINLSEPYISVKTNHTLLSS